MLSLTKLGNLKLGIVRNGKPIQTERILVTKATKEGEENFQILDGFNPDGEEKVKISLPFDSIDLNFEVNYVGFVTVNDVEYISKASDIGEDLILYPLDVLDFNLPSIKIGALTEEMIETYNLEKTGFLKCMVENVSGFGEVFYLKTKSVHSIRAILDQLKILTSLTGGYLSGVPLVLKAIKKDIKEKQIVYVSVSYEGSLKDLSSYISDRKNSEINFQNFEDFYVESRIPNIVEYDNKATIKIERDTEQEITEIQNQAEKEKAIETKEDVLLSKLIKDAKVELTVPRETIYAVFKAMKFNEEEFTNFIKDDVTLQKCLLKLKESRN